MSKTTITRTYTFSASHRLPHVPEGHKCGRLHGHNYSVTLSLTGPVCPRMGWVIDFADVDTAFAPLLERFDHQHLNDVVENPTSELLARWIATQLDFGRLELGVTVCESDRSGATFGCVPWPKPEVIHPRPRS